MIHKQADDKQEDINTLKQLLEASGSEKQKALIRKDLNLLSSGAESERQDAYYIDFHAGKSKNIVVLHDIRLEYSGRTAQIDHMIISRLGIELLESKSFKAPLTINADGSLRVDYRSGTRTFPNPLEQSRRHAEVLREFLEEHAGLSGRISLLGGIEISSAVLIHPSTTLTNDELPKGFFRSDSYMSERAKELDRIGYLKAVRMMAKLIGMDTVKAIADLLVAHHKPVRFDYRKKYRIGKKANAPEKKISQVTETEQNQSQPEKTQLQPNDPCPFCENPLVLREGKNGSAFLGCSSYPKCRFTRRISKAAQAAARSMD